MNKSCNVGASLNSHKAENKNFVYQHENIKTVETI